MLKRVLAGLSLLIAPLCWAVDTYNPGNNQLTIPSVNVSGTTYNNVVITVGNVIRVDGGTPSGVVDIYSPASNQLSIPTVNVNGQTYTNVVISVGQVLSVGVVSNNDGSSAGGSTGSDSTADSATTNASSVLVTTFIAIN